MLKKFLTIGAMQITARLATVLVSIILARELGPSGFGMYAVITALIALATIPVGQAFSPILIRELAGAKNSEDSKVGQILDFVRKYQIFAVVSGVILVVVTLVNSEHIELKNDRVLLAVIVGIVIVKCSSVLRGAILKGFGFVKEAQYPETLISPIVVLVAVSSIAYLGLLSLQTTIVAVLLSYVIANLTGRLLLKKKKVLKGVKFDRGWEIKTYAPQIFYFLVLAISHNSSEQLIILISAVYLTPEEVAGLKIAISLTALMGIGLMIANQILSPEIARLKNVGRLSEITKSSKEVNRLSLGLSIPFAFIIFIWTNEIIGFTFGPEYSDVASTAVRVFVVAQIINMAFGSVGTALNMMGDEKISILGHVAGLLVKLICIYIFVEKYGIIGVAFAYLLGVITWNVILTFILYKRYKINVSVF